MKRGAGLLVVVSALVTVLVPSAGAAVTPEAGFGDSGSSGGYVVTPRSVSKVSAQWVIPHVSCSTPYAAVSFAVGLIDSTNGRFTRLGVDVDCVAGRAHYGAYIRLPGAHRATLHAPVAPGDAVSATMWVTDGRLGASMTGSSWVAIIRTDARLKPTRAAVLATMVRGSSERMRPLADFRTLTFTHSRVDGGPIEGRAERLTMRNDDGERRVLVSPLDRSRGRFSLTWLHG
jgi:hypothetical protein